MDFREQFDNQEEALRTMIGAILSQSYVALPVIVDADTSDGHSVTLKSAVKGRIKDEKSGKWKDVDMPLFKDVPIHFANGGGAVLTHPVKKGDEGVVLFMSRGDDNWREKGGVQKAIDSRVNSLSNGRFIPGGRSDPKKIQNYSKNTTQLRSEDGKHMVELDHANGKITTSIDGGKHTIVASAEGISHKSEVAVKVEAPKMTSSGGTWQHSGNMRVTGRVHAVEGIKSAAIEAPDASVADVAAVT